MFFDTGIKAERDRGKGKYIDFKRTLSPYLV
jgi:hypothetical protein